MLGLVDTTGMSEWVMLACHLAVALVAVVLLRIGLQLALLHEVHDEIQSDQPLLCPYCGHVVPDMAFCPACGAATRATSRSSRRARRQHRPVRTDAEGGHQ
jgi:rRNA maturation endonuclease Nob1